MDDSQQTEQVGSIHSFRTNNIDLAAALFTLGIPLDPAAGVIHDTRQSRSGQVYWIFNDQVKGCNGLTAPEIAKLWDFQKLKEHETANPEDPLCYLRIQAHNKERLLDMVKSGLQLHIVARGGKTYLVTA